jgi:2'-5' RNA ligase
MKDELRLFFALWPAQQEREQLAAAGAALSLAPPARLVSAGNVHLTVAFVGAVAQDSLARVRRIGRELEPVACEIRFDA